MTNHLKILLTLLLPAVLIGLLLRTRYTSALKLTTDTLVIALALLLPFLAARWEMTSYYLRFVPFPALAVAAWIAYRKIEREEEAEAGWRRHLRENAGNLVLIVLALGANLFVLNGYRNPGQEIELAYPLRDGSYYISGGGNNRLINNHNAFPPQDYAVDILRLNSWGRVRSGASDDLQSYEIFGVPIYSPCTGLVVRAVDGKPDQIPPSRDSANIAGNYVLLECQNAEILLAHMQEGSVLVAGGDEVQQGQEIGAVGNSGNSRQPHLHIHAERGGTPGQILDGHGVPMTFDGRFLVRNNLIRNS